MSTKKAGKTIFTQLGRRGGADPRDAPYTYSQATAAPARNGLTRPPSPSMSVPEKRVAVRRPASEIPSITAVRLSPQGTRATLVNISDTGILVESPASLKPTSTVTVVFEGTFAPSTIPSRVARTTVVGLGKSGGLRYHIGIAFTKPITLEARPAASGGQTSTAGTPDIPEPLQNRW